jgi:hypothetical protein
MLFYLNIAVLVFLAAYFIYRAARALGTTPPNKVRHLGRGTTYEIIGLATAQAPVDGIHDNDRVFVYRDTDSEELYVRDEAGFVDPERFEKVK